jgi:hypothetical protein
MAQKGPDGTQFFWQERDQFAGQARFAAIAFAFRFQDLDGGPTWVWLAIAAKECHCMNGEFQIQQELQILPQEGFAPDGPVRIEEENAVAIPFEGFSKEDVAVFSQEVGFGELV